MSDNDKHYHPAGSLARDSFDVHLSRDEAGWAHSSLRIVRLDTGGTFRGDTGDEEILVLPLAGQVSVTVNEDTYDLTGRDSVFTSLTDYIFLPRHTTFELTSQTGGRFALPGARASRDLPVRYCPRSEANTGIRGSGVSSRQVSNYALGNEVETSHLLVCEVITPGGNWSSFPPHKHDEHNDKERVLEEIYYFEIAPGGPDDKVDGFGLQRVYSSPGHPIDICTEIRNGDLVTVPHGYHGPSVAAPGHDMYYLNVMAGPAEDAVWLMTDDPVHTWQRQTWEDDTIDPRLPFFTEEA